MGTLFLAGLNKKRVVLAESKVAKIPEAEVSVYYVEGKNLLDLPGQKKLQFEAAFDKAFESRINAVIDTVSKNLQDADVKLERAWEASPKGADDVARIVRATQKNVADALVELQKKIYFLYQKCLEETRPVGPVVGPVDSQIHISLTGKVTESAEAKSAAGATADAAEARDELVDSTLKITTQIESDLKAASSIASKAAATLDDSEDDATRATEQMKDFLKSKGGKEAAVLKATTLMLARQLKATTDHMSGVHAHVWEAQRHAGLLEKAVKPLKAPSLLNEIKNCLTAIDKAEKPLEDWLKGKALIDNGQKPWDGKSVRDYAKLAALLKAIGHEGLIKLLKSASESTTKLATAIEAARVEKS